LKKVLAMFILVFLLLPSAAHAQQVMVNGKALNAEIHLYNNRILVPMRPIFEALGATVNWNGSENTITARKGNTEIQLKISSPIAFINGKEVLLDTPPELALNMTLVPLRFVSSALGAEVGWDGKTKTVTITYVEENRQSGKVINGLRITASGPEEQRTLGGENKVVIIKLTLENVADERLGFGVGQFSLVDKNGTVYDYLTYNNFGEYINYEEELFRSPPADLGSVALEPGEVHEGKLGFLIPITTQGYKLLFESLGEIIDLSF